MNRREYDLNIVVNGIGIRKLIIDPHYEKKHAASVSDRLILELILTLDGQEYSADSIVVEYAYFIKDLIPCRNKFYKLVWLLQDRQIYIGVINAYRR